MFFRCFEEIRGILQERLGEAFGNALGDLREALESPWGHIGETLGTPWETFWENLGKTLEEPAGKTSQKGHKASPRGGPSEASTTNYLLD